MVPFFTLDSPPEVQPIDHLQEHYPQGNIQILRLDSIHPELSGNKWFKLKYNLNHALQHHYAGILTFGGAYSNHLFSTAAGCDLFSLRGVGIVRGEQPEELNGTLQYLNENNFECRFVSRSDYRKHTAPDALKALQEANPHLFVVPEGGSNSLGLKGVKEILEFVPESTDYLTLPIGTGSTAAGLLWAIYEQGLNLKVVGYAALKQGAYLWDEIQSMLAEHISAKELKQLMEQHFQLRTEYHFGGFAKYPNDLAEYHKEIEEKTGLPLCRVYGIKHFYGVEQDLKAGRFPKGKDLVMLHTGGLRPF